MHHSMSCLCDKYRKYISDPTKSVAWPEDLCLITAVGQPQKPIFRSEKNLALPEDLFEKGIMSTTKVTFNIWEKIGMACGPMFENRVVCATKVTFQIWEELGMAQGPIFEKRFVPRRDWVSRGQVTLDPVLCQVYSLIRTCFPWIYRLRPVLISVAAWQLHEPTAKCTACCLQLSLETEEDW
jgi:hypothetical protein